MSPQMKTAPTAFVSWAHDDDEWAKTIAQFVLRLRSPGGIDADVDLFHLHEPGIEWTSSWLHAVRASDFVLIAVSGRYRLSFERPDAARAGKGAAYEAHALRALLREAPNQLHPKAIVVLLPGVTVDDIPPDLRMVQRYDVPTIDNAGLEGLLRTIHGRPKDDVPATSDDPPVPLLPPALESLYRGQLERGLKGGPDDRDATASPPPRPENPSTVANRSPAERDAEFDRIVAGVVLEIAPDTEFVTGHRPEGTYPIDPSRADVADRFLSEYERLVGDRELDDETIERAARIAAAERSWRDGLGVLLDEEDVARLINVDPGDIAARAANHEIIVLTRRDGSVRFPAYQFQDGLPTPTLAHAHQTLVENGRISPWSAASWARTAHPELELRSPAQWAGERRDAETLLAVAERDAARLVQ